MQNYICSSCGNSFEAAPDGAGMIVCAYCGTEIKAENAEVPLAPGTKVEGYEILRHLGSGGNGDVYLAEQSLMERKVALKLLKNGSMDPEKAERFFEEARNTAMFDDPRMVSVLDMGTSEDGYCYLATRYVDGETLESLLDRNQIFGQKRALGIVIEVASALSNVWDKTKMFHRDIKPGNIMLSASDEVMILDMGIAQTYGESSLDNGEVEGSPYYMSPEQARGEKLFWSTDMYSLGVTFYQMLTGLHPYDAPTVREILEMHNSRPFPEIAVRAPRADVSPAVEALLKRMMGKIPAERFTSWSEFLVVARDVYRGLKDPVQAKESGAADPAQNKSFGRSGDHAGRNGFEFFHRQIWFLVFLAVMLISASCAGFFLYLAARKNSHYADRCLLEASEIVQQKNWKAEELEEVLDEFRPVIDRLGVNPSVRKRFRSYREQARVRRDLEKKEQDLLVKLELETAQILEQTQRDLESCRYNPVLAGVDGKTASYTKVIRQILARRNTVSRTEIVLPDNVKRKRVLFVRLHKASNAVVREFRQLCAVPHKKESMVSARKRKNDRAVKPAEKKSAAAVSRSKADPDKKTAVRSGPEKKAAPKRVVRRRPRAVPQAKQKLLVLKNHQKVFLKKVLDQPDVLRNSASNPLLRQLRPVRNADAYWRNLTRALLAQSRSFYGRIYNSGKKYTDKELRVGSLNRRLKIWMIRKDRIYFRNEPVVRTFSQIYSGDWHDFLSQIAENENAQKDFEAYLLFTKNYLVLDESRMRNVLAKRLLPGIRALHSRIRSQGKKQ